jgi:hypothetical protein
MAQEHGIDRPRVDAELAHAHHGGRTAIEQQAIRVGIDEKAGLQAVESSRETR